MGPSQGSEGGEGKRRGGLEQTDVFKGFVVNGVLFSWHTDLEGHVPLLFGAGIDVSDFRTFRITALQHVEVLSADEGKSVVEPLLGEIDKGTCGERGVVTIHHGGQIPLCGADGEGGAALQSRQGIEFRGDLPLEAVLHQQSFHITDVAEGLAAIADEAGFVDLPDPFLHRLQVLFNLLQVGLGTIAPCGGNRLQDGPPAGAEQRFTAGHGLPQRTPPFCPQVITGELQPMLQFADVVLLEGQRIPQDCRGILHRIALGQCSPGWSCNVDQGEAEQGDQNGLETRMGQGGTPVLTGLWHSRIVR